VSSCTQRRGERGVTLPLVAVFIVVLFAFAALAIDLGILYTARTSEQHAADAGALAGAFTFLQTPNESPQQKTIDAQNAAIAVTNRNRILGQSPNIAAANVVVDPDNQRVTVRVQGVGGNGIATFFARAIGWNTVAVGAKATAQAGPSASASSCLKPLFIMNTAFATAANGCPDQVLFNQDGTISRYALTQLLPNLGTELMQQIAEEPIGQQGTPPDPHGYDTTDFGLGGNGYECSLEHCLNACGLANPIRCQGTQVTPGFQPPALTNQGIDNLIGGPPPTFQWTGPRNYLNNNDGQHYDMAPNVVVAPVLDNCHLTAPPFNIVGFVQLFVDNFVADGKGTLNVHLLNVTTCNPPPSPTGGTSGPLGVPVRLVQNP
jgi:Flp pilus assembly protein TadG